MLPPTPRQAPESAFVIEPGRPLMAGARSQLATGATRGFVYLRCDARAHHSAEWQWNAGDRGLFYLQNPVDYRANLVEALPEAARQMERRLDGWLRWLGQRSTNGRLSAAA